MRSPPRTARSAAVQGRGGALLLVSPDGTIDTLYYERTSTDTLRVTASDSIEYTARRR